MDKNSYEHHLSFVLQRYSALPGRTACCSGGTVNDQPEIVRVTNVLQITPDYQAITAY
jgi:hypothetical protein